MFNGVILDVSTRQAFIFRAILLLNLLNFFLTCSTSSLNHGFIFHGKPVQLLLYQWNKPSSHIPPSQSAAQIQRITGSPHLSSATPPDPTALVPCRTRRPRAGGMETILIITDQRSPQEGVPIQDPSRAKGLLHHADRAVHAVVEAQEAQPAKVSEDGFVACKLGVRRELGFIPHKRER